MTKIKRQNKHTIEPWNVQSNGLVMRDKVTRAQMASVAKRPLSFSRKSLRDSMYVLLLPLITRQHELQEKRDSREHSISCFSLVIFGNAKTAEL